MRRLLVALVTGVYWLAMAVATHLPPQPGPPGRVDDKLKHFAGYAVLAALLTQCRRRGAARQRFAVAVAIAAAYGAIDEITQPLAGRTADAMDWVADVAGALCGAAGALMLERWAAARASARA